MAMLQAARARKLGLGLDSAYSWGLNRAIFYAAAKAGFGRHGSGGGEGGAPKEHPGRELYHLGTDEAYRDTSRSKILFTIGDETQTEQDFERQISDRFGGESNFAKAWKEAESIVGDADRATLESGREFYERVYRPRRDLLKDKWTEMVMPVGSASGASG